MVRIASRAALVFCPPRGLSSAGLHPRSMAASEIRPLEAWLRHCMED